MREDLKALKHGQFYNDGLVEVWRIHELYILFDIIRDTTIYHYKTYSLVQFEIMIMDINRLT